MAWTRILHYQKAPVTESELISTFVSIRFKFFKSPYPAFCSVLWLRITLLWLQQAQPTTMCQRTFLQLTGFKTFEYDLEITSMDGLTLSRKWDPAPFLIQSTSLGTTFHLLHSAPLDSPVILRAPLLLIDAFILSGHVATHIRGLTEVWDLQWALRPIRMQTLPQPSPLRYAALGTLCQTPLNLCVYC